jgi:hypothetical protein
MITLALGVCISGSMTFFLKRRSKISFCGQFAAEERVSMEACPVVTCDSETITKPNETKRKNKMKTLFTITGKIKN